MTKRLLRVDDSRVRFTCPGCGDVHMVDTTRWKWNGDMEKPTFSPSLLIRTGHHVPNRKDEGCWCTFNEEQRAAGKPETRFECYVCHSFVRDGQIQFLSDCTHSLAGKTVPLFRIMDGS